jgi:hypothetical protein
MTSRVDVILLVVGTLHMTSRFSLLAPYPTERLDVILHQNITKSLSYVETIKEREAKKCKKITITEVCQQVTNKNVVFLNVVICVVFFAFLNL